MSEQVISHATVVSKNSNQLIVDFESMKAEFANKLLLIQQGMVVNQQRLEENNQTVLQKMNDLWDQIEVVQKRVGEIADETEMRDEEYSRDLNQLLKNDRITRILMISGISISGITLLTILFPYIRPLFIR